MQQLEVSVETMLGSAEKATELMSQLTRTAATTPFGLTDVAQGAKQLLAYGLEAEKVNETLIRLGDIAAGLSIPLMVRPCRKADYTHKTLISLPGAEYL